MCPNYIHHYLLLRAGKEAFLSNGRLCSAPSTCDGGVRGPSRCRAVGVLVPHQASCLHPPLSVVVACVKCHWCGGPCIPDLHLPREMHGSYWGVNVPNTALVTSQIRL